MSQYRSRLPATKVERCACARLCRGGLGLWRIFTNISRGFFGLLFYSFSNSQPPSARCADVLGASFQPLQTVCSRNLLADVHTASLHSKTRLYTFSRLHRMFGGETKSRLLVCIQIGVDESGVQDNPLTISLRRDMIRRGKRKEGVHGKRNRESIWAYVSVSRVCVFTGKAWRAFGFWRKAHMYKLQYTNTAVRGNRPRTAPSHNIPAGELEGASAH